VLVCNYLYRVSEITWWHKSLVNSHGVEWARLETILTWNQFWYHYIRPEQQCQTIAVQPMSLQERYTASFQDSLFPRDGSLGMRHYMNTMRIFAKDGTLGTKAGVSLALSQNWPTVPYTIIGFCPTYQPVVTTYNVTLTCGYYNVTLTCVKLIGNEHRHCSQKGRKKIDWGHACGFLYLITG